MLSPADAFLPPEQWRCTMVWGAYNGLPMGLEKIGAVLGLEQQKLREGKDLIRLFCVPRGEMGGMMDRYIRPEKAPEKWELFKRYNRRDVEVELQIQKRLENYPVPERVWEEYWIDQRINDRGIRVDRELVEQAIRLDAESQAALMEEMKKLTGLENPNSVSQLKSYLAENGTETETLGKKQVAELLKGAEGDTREVRELRLQSAKSSVRKYEAMRNAVCRDGRCRGMFQFYGASRSGRWSGRLVQLQNLPQNHIPDLDEARELVKAGDRETLELLYGSVPGLLSELVRTAFIPEEGGRFIVADYSAIEARVLSHLAGEYWRTEVFRTGGDIYCESASKMFHVPVVKNGINGHLRQKGKIAELALGYGGGVGALKSMGAIEMGVPEDELQPLVDMWREANPNIVRYWWELDAAARAAVKEQGCRYSGGVCIEVRNGMMFIVLPSGRSLAYVKPRIGENQYGDECITYCGTGATKKWDRLETYGPKLTENIVQAISRDILAEAMRRLERYRIVGHVHDEIIIEAREGDKLEEVCEIMSRTPDWIKGLKLRADGYVCRTYRKE